MGQVGCLVRLVVRVMGIIRGLEGVNSINGDHLDLTSYSCFLCLDVVWVKWLSREIGRKGHGSNKEFRGSEFNQW